MTGLPFTAVVGHDDVRRALLLAAIDPGLGGVLLTGEKGTAKTTLVRGLAALLPELMVVEGCRFSCAPEDPDPGCPDGPHPAGAPAQLRPARLVELPLGAGDDRITGSLDVAKVLGGASTAEAFTPGLLAAAHRGVLYVDEVNLLPDALVDLLLDAAATGRVTVEREGLSVRHAARFVLVGTMNPEEGELRPQLLDRFGLSVPVVASSDPVERAAAVRVRLSYDGDPAAAAVMHAAAERAVAASVVAARAVLPAVRLDDEQLLRVTRACAALGVDGLRGDLVTSRAAMALAAWDGRDAVTPADVREAARLALPHRRRRGPFDSPSLAPGELDDALGPADQGPDEEPEPPAGGPPDDREAPQPQSQPGSGSGSPGEQPAPAPADAGEEQASPATQPSRATAPDAAYTPRHLQTVTPHAGTAGRRSRGTTASGRPVASIGHPTRPELLPTLRAAAPHQHARGRSGAALVLGAGDLRRAVRTGRTANLVVVAVDTSGSMAARRRTRAVTTAVLSLLTDAYRRRDRVAVISFRGATASTVVPPTGSVEVAAARLADLPVGGRTPLAAGLREARDLIRRERRRDPSRAPLLVVITDGRATDGRGTARAGDVAAAANALARLGVSAVVVDAEDGPVRLRLAADLAGRLGAELIALPDLAAADSTRRDAATTRLADVVSRRAA